MLTWEFNNWLFCISQLETMSIVVVLLCFSAPSSRIWTMNKITAILWFTERMKYVVVEWNLNEIVVFFSSKSGNELCIWRALGQISGSYRCSPLNHAILFLMFVNLRSVFNLHLAAELTVLMFLPILAIFFCSFQWILWWINSNFYCFDCFIHFYHLISFFRVFVFRMRDSYTNLWLSTWCHC